MKFNKVSKEQYEQACNNELGCYIPWEELKLPKRATKGSAGYDIYATRDFTLYQGDTIKFPTGINVDLDDDKLLMIVPRSGLGFRYNLSLSNTVGIIDSDYRNSDNEGHIFVKLYYPECITSPNHIKIKAGDAICQGIITSFYTTEDDDSQTIRNGGLGSTTERKED